MSGRRKQIFFDQTQNERGRLDTTYSELGSMLRDHDFDVEPYTEFMILPKEIKNADVLVFGCPNSSKLRPAEIDALKKYVKDGGGLMLLSLSGGDRGLMNNMSQISKSFGISFENTAVKDERNNAGLPTMPIILDIVNHPVTEDVEDLLLPSACTLKVTGKGTVIANTSESADPACQPVVAIAESGKGRVLCVGSYEVFRRGGGIKHKGNSTFALKAFRWLAGERRIAKPSEVAVREKEPKPSKKEALVAEVIQVEMENTLRRLVNAVFDLQKDIEKVQEKITSVDGNVGRLRDQFQEFAETTQKQLGLMIPAKQFQSPEENQAAEIEADIKGLKKEIKSVEQLRKHVEQRHSSGAMPSETYDEQIKKLDSRSKSLNKKLEKKEKELEKILQ